MNIVTDKKYYCLEPENFIKFAEFLGFKRVNNNEVVDEYFIDYDRKFIENLNCLRIRKINNCDMYITFKGKSDSLLGKLYKFENDIKAHITEYQNYVNLFFSLGYYSYVVAKKNKLTYELLDKKYKYIIKIDIIPEVGCFILFEVDSGTSRVPKEELRLELDKFIDRFGGLKIKKFNSIYRDVVASNLYKKMIGTKEKVNLCLDLDQELSKYEKDFYRLYKDKISEVCGYNIKWGEYKKNINVDKKIRPLVEEYLDDLIYDKNQLLLTMRLLSNIKYKKYIITKVNETFFNCFLDKLDMIDKNVLFIRGNDTIINVLNKNKVSIKDSILINDNDLKKCNSLLFILINEK